MSSAEIYNNNTDLFAASTKKYVNHPVPLHVIVQLLIFYAKHSCSHQFCVDIQMVSKTLAP